MENKETRKMNRTVLRRAIMACFCVFIGISVTVVMFGFYEPNQNALRALSSVCMDVICILILLVLIGSFAFNNYDSKRTTRLFAGLLVATIWALFLDFLNWAFDGSLQLGHLTYWFTMGSLCMGAILACIFSLYLYSYMEETHGLVKMWKSAFACSLLNLLSFGLTLLLALAGTAFEFVDGHYELGAFYDAVTVVPVLTLLYLTGYVICYTKKVGVHDVFAVAGYIFFMIAGALIEAAYVIGTTYVAVAIADIFIYVMLQNEIIAKEKRNVQEWMRKSHMDELTGFYNRNAYEEDLVQLETTAVRDDFVYVSVDVNSLKMVNDTYGHTAGDEMLVGAAVCMAKCFGAYGKLYRIGGDEFCALIYTDEDRLNIMRKDIEDMAKNWKGELSANMALACGYVTKAEAGEATIREMAVLADQRMYADKDAYYLRTGIERRKK